MIDPTIYEKVITDVLDTIAEMRGTGDYDENTLETLEWKLAPPKDGEASDTALSLSPLQVDTLRGYLGEILATDSNDALAEIYEQLTDA